MSPAAVELEQVFCVHRSPEGDAAALQGLTLQVGVGEVVCIIGPSGAGKSTLLRVVAGAEIPSSGDLRCLGREMGRLPAGARARLRREQIGFLGQNWRSILSPELPLREAVAMPLMLRRAQPIDARAEASRLLQAAGLGGRESARARELSGGELQRAAVCAALVHRPALLLADEPTGELDRIGAIQVRSLIRELSRASGASVVIVSHDPDTAAEADRALRMRDGRIEAEISGDGESRLIDPRGWVRLPREHLDSAAIENRVRITSSEGGVLVTRSGAAAVGSAITAVRGVPVVQGPADECGPDASGEDVDPDWTGAHVELRAVVRHRRDGTSTRAILDRFSLAVAPGRVTVLSGPSGAGKSTLLRLIAGLESPDEGELLLDGSPYAGFGSEQLAALRRRRMGYLSQDPAPVAFLSAQENIVFALSLRDVDPAHATVRAQAVLASVGLRDRATQRVGRLSAGEAQRVGLARALACARGLLVLDEPTSHLDEGTAGRMADLLISASRRSAQTVVCASHDEQLIARADTVVSLAGQ